jgi:hypothetical protein
VFGGANRRKHLTFACVAVLAGAALFMLAQKDEAPALASVPAAPVSVSEDGGEQAPEAHPEPVVAVASAAPAAMAAAPAVAPVDEHPAVRQYRTLTRYPATTRRIHDDSHDLLHPNARHERRGPLPAIGEDGQDADWEVLYTADRYFVYGADPAAITLELWRDGEPVLPEDLTLIASPDAADVQAPPVVVSFETVAGRIQALFSPNDFWPDLVGPVRVTATFGAPGIEEQTGYLTFYFTGEERIPARFTGDFRDSVRDGDLVIDVGVDVATAGTFYVEANLYDVDGRPFGWARYEGALGTGNASVPLRYYGLLFHDAQASPPFTVGELRGFRLRPSDMPNREDMRPWDGVYRTGAAYVRSDFSDRENDSARRRKMLAMYQDAIDRGVRLTEAQFTGTAP